MKKVSGRLANLTPEQREKLLKKLREQKVAQENAADSLDIQSENQSVEQGEFLGLSAGEKVLSFSQQRLWFLDQLEGQSAVYNIPARLHIEGYLDVEALRDALVYLFARHDALRSVFPEVDGAAQLKLLAQDQFDLEIEDSSHLDFKEQQHRLMLCSEKIAKKQFDLANEVLFKAHLLILSEHTFELLICMHHMIADAWSMRILVRELSLAYNQLKRGEAVNLGGKPASYLDYAVWQKQRMDSEKYQQQTQFWKQKLAQVKPLVFPFDKPRPLTQSYEGKQLLQNLSLPLSQKLRQLARQESTTLFSVLLSAWYLILSRYSHQKDFCIGTPVANRPYSTLENSIGFFLNTVAIRIHVNENSSVREFLDMVKKSALESFANADLPFEKIINDLNVQRDPSQSPVFQSMFSFQNDALEQHINFEGLKVELSPIHTETAKFDVSMDVIDQGESIQLALEFNCALLSEVFAQALQDNFVHLLEQLVEHTHARIGELKVLTEQQHKLLRVEWNGKARAFDSTSDLAKQFEARVALNPDKIALRTGETCLSYQALNSRANQLAHALNRSAYANLKKAGVLLEKPEDYLVAIFALLKLGITYIPLASERTLLEGEFDNKRFHVLVNEAVCALPVFQNHASIHCIVFESLTETNGENLELDIDSEKLALPYASHRSISNTADWYRSALSELKRHQALEWCCVNSWQALGKQGFLLSALLNGETLNLFSETDLFPLTQNNHFTQLNHVVLNCSSLQLDALTTLVSGFENQLSAVFLNDAAAKLGHLQASWLNAEFALWNCYCVETSGELVSAHRLNKTHDTNTSGFNVGRAIQNYTIYLLDDALRPVPAGAWGRIYVGAHTDAMNELQRCNDFARYDAQGNLILFPLLYLDSASAHTAMYADYLQTHAQLLNLDDVQQALLFETSQGLCALVVLTQVAHTDESSLLSALKHTLPFALLPHSLVLVKHLPVNTLGELLRDELLAFLQVRQSRETFWQNYLAEQYELAFAHQNQQVQSFYIEQKHLNALAALERESFLRAAWLILLARYTGQTEFFYSHHVHSTPLSWVYGKADIFIPVKVNLADDESFLHFSQMQTQELAQLGEHLGLPLPEKSCLLSFAETDAELLSGSDLHLSIGLETQGQTVLRAKLFYDAGRFEEESIRQLVRHYLRTLEFFSEQLKQQQAWDAPNLLDETEQQAILSNATGEQAVYEAFNTVDEFLKVFEHDVAIALVYIEDGKQYELSYQDLHQRANQLAVYLQTQGLEPTRPVALCLQRSVEMVVAILAVLKTGSPYLPLDPALPQDRLAFMLDDSQAQFVLCSGETRPLCENFSGRIDLQDAGLVKACRAIDRLPHNHANALDLFNIIYTSGSTGQPKGVMVTHEGILNRIQWMQEAYQLTQASRVLQKTTYSFDVSVWEFIWPLSQGATLVLASADGHKDPLYLRELMAEQGITHCHFVPSMLSSWLDAIDDKNVLNERMAESLQKVFCSGEALTRKAVNHFYALFRHSELHNLYGPTEASIDVSYWPCEKNMPDATAVPIGKPVSNTALYVLDKQFRLLPYGVAGELFIAGKQLARGYLNRPQLNDSTFIEVELPHLGKQLLYRTGDLVRLNRRGYIDYLGRIDHQVKVRGFRIELGEIETCVQAMAEVSLAVVVVRELGNSKQLVAYVCLTDNFFQKSQKDQHHTFQIKLKQFLSARLPEYMVPAVTVVLDTMPMLGNGKINRKALPEPQLSSLQTQAFKAANSEIEAQLQAIWQKVLGVEKIGTRDNFFDLGGDSILSIQIISAARRQGIVIKPNHIFRYPTISELARVASVSQKTLQVNQESVLGENVVSPVQNWFFSEIALSDAVSDVAANHHFNQSVLLDLKCEPDLAALEKMVAVLLEKHDVLTSGFKQHSGIWKQHYNPFVSSETNLAPYVSQHTVQRNAEESDAQSLQQTLMALHKTLNFEQGTGIHFALLHELDSGIEKHLLFIVAHHLVIDGVSWRIVLEDLNTLFENRNQPALESLLPAKTLSFKDWNQGLLKLAQSDYFKTEKDYWKHSLKALRYYQSPLILEQGKDRHSIFANQKRIAFSLSHQFSEQFLKQAQRNFNADANDILLCALAEVLSNNQLLALNLEMHGRELPEAWSAFLEAPDVSRTVGWFTSIFPVLLQHHEAHQTWPEKLKNIKEQLRRIPAKGLGFGLLSRTGTQAYFKEASLRAAKLDISFNYLGQLDQALNSQFFAISQARNRLAHLNHMDQADTLKRPHLLDIVVYINAGSLHCEFLYDAVLMQEAQILAYAQHYQQALESLIENCCAQLHPLLSPSDLLASKLNQKEIEQIEHSVYSSNSVLPFASIESIHDLLPTQQGMLFHTLFSGADETHQYIEQFCVELKGQIHTQHFQSAWQCLIKKYANLRSIFYWQTQQPVQVVLSDVDFTVEHVDFSAASSHSKQSVINTLEDFLAKDRQRKFELSQLPLMRVYLVQFAPEHYWLVWSYHHILLDGWSVPLVLNDVFEFYTALCAGHDVSKLTLGSLYRFEDYVAWYQKQNAALEAQQEQFWKTLFEGFSAANAIDIEAISQPIPKDEQGDGVVKLELGEVLSDSLRYFARKHQLTLNTVMQAAWAILLAHYSGDEDVVFGTTVSGRPEDFEGVEQIVGMFINTLPLRVQLDARSHLLRVLHTIQESQQAINEYQGSSLMRIQKWVGMDDDSRLFDSMLVFENFPVDEKLKQDNPLFSVGELHSFEQTNYPLTLIIEPNKAIRLRVLFDSSVYRKSTVMRLLGHLETLLGHFPQHGNTLPLDIPYMKAEELRALEHWNKTETSYPRDATLIELFAEKAMQFPQHLALKFDEQILSYKALDERSNQLARYLNQQGIAKGQRVALFLDRSEAMLISVLAVVKTGAAYVPLDPDYPRERLQYMLGDCGPAHIISLSRYQAQLDAANAAHIRCPLVFYDQLLDALEQFDAGSVDFYKNVQATDLAYLMYTSGSTGQPKGVCLSHRSMIRLLINNWYLNLGPNDKVGHVVNVCFDASAYEIWGALLHGACLIGFDKETVLNGERFEEKLQREAVSNMLLTTSLFHIYSKQRPGMFKKMRSLLIGGEPLNADATRRVLQNEPPLQILNVYGPTENGVLTTVFDTWNLLSDASNVPVGKAISNTTVYILDKRNKEVPVGVIGELVSGGDGVGIGYWRKPELSSQSYIEDPISKVAGARAYRTGDLARRLADGSFEVLGRRDKQIKIRGFRIEPGEIIKYMLEEQRVQDAVIHVHESETGQKLLLGYYVLKQGEQLEAKMLLARLKEKLPQYMVPQFLIEIPALPITPNGKLDTTQLPAPRLAQQDHYQAPRNEVEQKLLEVWREVLGLEQIGIRDNFFEVGGDSIISIQIVSRAKRSGIELSPKLLFEYPSIIELAQQLDYQDDKPKAEQGLVQGEVPLSPVQQWFFEQQFAVPDHFNQSLLFKVKGFLSIQSITPVLSALLRQHDALRLRFEFQQREWRQTHDNSARSLSLLADVLTEHNLSHSAQAYQDMLEHARKLQGSLSIEHGPLIKMVLYHLGEQGQRLLVLVHHLVVDGVSWRILVDDLNLALEQHFDNQAIDLGSKSSSFQFYAQKLEERVEAKTFSEAIHYWSAFEASLVKRTLLSRTPDTHATASKLVQKRFVLDSNLSQSLLRDSHHAYKTDAQALLLLIYALAVKQSGISETLCIELESHGRDVHDDTLLDLSNTVGWFTVMYPVLLDFNQSAIDAGNFDQAIKTLKNTLHSVPLKGLSYFLAKYVYRTHSGERLLKQLPKIELAFNYLGQVQAEHDTRILTLDSEYLEQNLATIEDSSPLNQPSHLLSVSILMRAQSFHISVNYDEAHIATASVDKFIEAFQHYAHAVNDFCVDETHFGFTVSDLPYCGLTQTQIDVLCAAQQAHANSTFDAIYPLSPMQEGMLFHSRMDSSSGMYCEQVSVLFSNQLNVSAMEAAWNGAINHHTILRSSFVWENLPRPLQLVQAHARVTLELLDWRNESNTQEKLNHFLAADRAKGFDFSKAPLMRLYYIVLPSEHSGQILGRFIWSYHHILLDGWSMPLLMREVFERYNAATQGLPLTVVAQEGSYQNYIDWLYQKSAQSDETYKKQRDQFWLNYLAGMEEPTHIGLAKSTPSQQTESALRYREHACVLSAEQSESLNQFAIHHHITLNTVFQAAWALLLARYSGEQNVLFGITVSGRPHELRGVETIVGLFINTIPFRARVDEKTSLSDWLQDIFRNQNQLREYETTPLVEIQAQSRMDSSRALFDSILVFENYPMNEAFDYSPAGLQIEDVQVYEQTNFPLSLIILPGKQLEIRMLFDSEQFEQQAIDTVLKHLKTLLLDIGNQKADAQRSLQNIDYLNEQEQFRIIKQWNNTETVYPRDSYLQDIVSEQARRYPDVEALCSEGKSLTFKALEAKANQLAHFICSDERGDFVVRQGDKVVICMNRSEELVISMLAVLKAGAVYVPLDPGYPEERQRYMLEDTRCHLVLTDQHHAELVKQLCATKSLKDHLGFVNLHQAAQDIARYPETFAAHLPPYRENEEVPAAILYTSGSTGQPKGVCLTHRGLSRMVMNTNYMQMTRDDRVAHVSNICFDAASFEIWAALLNAVPLVIFRKDIVLDLVLFEQRLKQEKVSILLIATALFNLVARERVSAFSELRYLFFGGEASNAGMVRKVLQEAPPQHLMHMYGPSENATYATWYEVKQVAEDAKNIPIGRAVSNSQVYIMNQQGSLLPPGVAGEIVCAGDGLALGYLNKPEQTQKAFVMRSLPNQAAQRMYLTGDLGIWLPDGTIEILGRIDNQVKIRGHRIEPEEVIARINALEHIKKSYVLVKQDSEDKKYLLAYFVPEASWLKQQSDAQQRARELKLTLKSLMPDYMVPSFYVEIDELPLTPNGKIDTKALPEADLMQAASVYQAPHNELEQKLVAIWAEVLGQSRIGVNDDFFELGGHSLLATQIHSRIRQQLGIDIPLRTLFELPTIREFSEFWLALSASEAAFDEDSGEAFEEGEL